jgi:hypothetical protein
MFYSIDFSADAGSPFLEPDSFRQSDTYGGEAGSLVGKSFRLFLLLFGQLASSQSCTYLDDLDGMVSRLAR